jgi:hypothetical protein
MEIVMFRGKEQRFFDFVRSHVRAIGQAGSTGYAAYGRGVVIINVAGLRGGKKFRIDQNELPLIYRPLTALYEESKMNPGHLDQLVAMSRRYEPGRQIVVAALHRDGIGETAYLAAPAEPATVG